MDEHDLKQIRSLALEIQSQLKGKVSVRPEGFYYSPFCPVRIQFARKENLYLSASKYVIVIETLKLEGPFLISIKSPCSTLGLLDKLTLKRKDERIQSFSTGLDLHRAKVKEVSESDEVWEYLTFLNSPSIEKAIFGWKQLSVTMEYRDLDEIIDCATKCFSIRDYSRGS